MFSGFEAPTYVFNLLIEVYDEEVLKGIKHNNISIFFSQINL